MFMIIQAPHFTAGIEVGKRAAPIIHYMLTWDETRIIEYCKKKGWCVISGDSARCDLRQLQSHHERKEGTGEERVSLL